MQEGGWSSSIQTIRSRSVSTEIWCGWPSAWMVASVSVNDFTVSTRMVTPTATPATISPAASTNHQALGRRRCGGGGGAP